MKTNIFTILLFLVSTLLPYSAKGETLLWSKEVVTSIEFMSGGGVTVHAHVGSDGTTAILFVIGAQFDNTKQLHWINRSGNNVSNNPTLADNLDVFTGFLHVSGQELILYYNDLIDQGGPTNNGYFIELLQESFDGSFQQKTIPSALGIGNQESKFINYPYILTSEVVDEFINDQLKQTYTFKLYDLTNPNALSVVGDAVIGVHGQNIKVRWKTVANAKYRVQYSPDLQTWTDYTETIDGNGSTMIVNIPIDEDSDQKYARVIKL